MKRIFHAICTIISIILPCQAYTQADEPYIYGELGIGYGTHNIYKAEVNSLFGGRQVLTSSYYYSLQQASTIPPNTYYVWNTPQQTVSLFGLSYGYAFFTATTSVRFILKGGVAAGQVSTPVDFIGHEYSIQRQLTMGITLDPSVEFPTGGGFGFAVSPYANINPLKSVIGFSGSMLFGRVKARTHRRV